MPPVKKPGAAMAPGRRAAAPANTKPGREINLDAARAARAEAQDEPVTLTMRGETFTLPPELPADFVMFLNDEDLRAAVSALFDDDESAAQFFLLRPSMDDIRALIELAVEKYGLTSGESEPSAAS